MVQTCTDIITFIITRRRRLNIIKLAQKKKTQMEKAQDRLSWLSLGRPISGFLQSDDVCLFVMISIGVQQCAYLG